MQDTWDGKYSDGASAESFAVGVTPTPECLEIRKGSQFIRLPYAELRRTLGAYRGEPVRLVRLGEYTEIVVVEDRGILDAIQEVARAEARHLTKGRATAARGAWIAIAFVVVLACGAALYFWVIPAMARYVAQSIPIAWEEAIGASVVEQLTMFEEDCPDDDAHRVLNNIVARLEVGQGSTGYTFRVRLLHNPQVNAFAAPGGFIVVYSGLVEAMHTPEQLAAVLAHEMQHIVKRHGTQTILADCSIAAVLSGVVGDMGSFLEVVKAGAQNLGVLAYRRSHESEADAQGQRTLAAANVDPHAMVEMLDLLEQTGLNLPDALSYVSSHPPTPERRAAALARAATIPVAAAILCSEEEWRSLREHCGK